MTVAVIYGGRSGEHEISLISAAAIARGIDKQHKVVLIGITKEGTWYLQNESEYERICKDTSASLSITETPENQIYISPAGKEHCFKTHTEALTVDVVFPALHGTYGEDGTIQGLLDMADIPYVGCGTMASSLTMDKEKTKQVLQAVGIPVVPYVCMKRTDMLDSRRYDQVFENAISTLGFPLFVKPCCAGSSNGASKATNPQELSFALMEAFSWDDKVLIEKAIPAQEIECSVTGNSTTADPNNDDEVVTAYIPGEILPTHVFYDFDAKYNDPNGARLAIPAEIKEKTLEKIRTIAVKAYCALDAAGLSRVDFFIDKETHQIYFNEINTMPGFTPISMFPKMCDAAGLEFTELTNLLLNEAVLRHQAKSKLQTSR
ncbi:MAG: D-alanine--D-alanine ligase [Treponema sp.]|nr:D-alanine--D-alanine ligase [Treponema sp.]